MRLPLFLYLYEAEPKCASSSATVQRYSSTSPYPKIATRHWKSKSSPLSANTIFCIASTRRIPTKASSLSFSSAKLTD